MYIIKNYIYIYIYKYIYIYSLNENLDEATVKMGEGYYF